MMDLIGSKAGLNFTAGRFCHANFQCSLSLLSLHGKYSRAVHVGGALWWAIHGWQKSAPAVVRSEQCATGQRQKGEWGKFATTIDNQKNTFAVVCGWGDVCLL
jgi:hypothetical protein